MRHVDLTTPDGIKTLKVIEVIIRGKCGEKILSAQLSAPSLLRHTPECAPSEREGDMLCCARSSSHDVVLSGGRIHGGTNAP